MSEECSHHCSSCGKECTERTVPHSLTEPANPASHIKKVIGVVSGKGGVGKSLVTALMASAFSERGLSVGNLGCGYYRSLYPAYVWNFPKS